MNLDYLKTYNEVIVIGHNNPDTDTILSSYLLANILNYFGINSKYALIEGEKPNDVAKNIIKDCINYNPLIINKKDINNYIYFLVDHNDVLQSILNKNLIVGVIDHHPNSNSFNNAIITKYCSTTLSIYELFKDKYNFSNEEKKIIFMGVLDDSSFGLNARYKDSDKLIVEELGFDSNLNEYFDKYFIPTDLSNINNAFNNNGLKNYNFNGICFKSTYIEETNTNLLNVYKDFIKNNNQNFLGLWIDFKNHMTYTFLKYNNDYLEKQYDYIAPRSTIVLNDTLEYIRSNYEKED